MNNAIVSVGKKVGFALRKHSPEILTGVGIVGGIAATVFACKATTKAQDILADTKDQIEAVHTVMEDETIDEETYSQEDSKKDLTIIYAQTGVKLFKVYAPAIALGVLSIVSILASNNIMRKRNVALAAAYTVVDNAFKEYRGNVVERFGKEVDRELRYNLKAEEVTETIEDENGKKKKVKKTIYKLPENGIVSGYARIFDAGNPQWENSPSLNLAYLKCAQEYFNLKLQQEGRLPLNEVYKYLGYRQTKEGQVVGWKYKDNNEDGDNFVDFGFMNDEAFMSGREASVVLDFNVDGYILDEFEELDRTWAVC